MRIWTTPQGQEKEKSSSYGRKKCDIQVQLGQGLLNINERIPSVNGKTQGKKAVIKAIKNS